jgi:hypothetical protein
MPDVVDPDVDDDNGRFFVDHVLNKPTMKIGDFVTADSCADDLNAEVRIAGFELFLEQCNIPVGLYTKLRDGVTEKEDPFPLA